MRATFQSRCLRRAGSLRVQCAAGAVLLEVKNLHAKVAGEEKQILNGVNLTIREGEVRPDWAVNAATGGLAC